MVRPELNETLTALVGAVLGAGEVEVVDVDLTVPMEISVATIGDRLVVRAAPGHTRFRSGFLPPVHHTHLRIAATVPDDLATWPAEPPDGWSA